MTEEEYENIKESVCVRRTSCSWGHKKVGDIFVVTKKTHGLYDGEFTHSFVYLELITQREEMLELEKIL